MLAKYQRIILLLFICVAIVAVPGCTKNVQPIAFNNISSFVLSEIETEQAVPCGEDRVRSFIDAYNEAECFRDDYGTTHPFRVDILFFDGSTLTVWGGASDFQTQLSNEEQHNIKSDALDKWFADE